MTPRAARGSDASPERGDRASVIRDLASLAAGDPRTLVGLLDRLAADPEPMVRQACVMGLARLPSSGAGREALQAAAAEDEDLNVRWAARYALSLVPDFGR
jgi:HEAT repeat protein